MRWASAVSDEPVLDMAVKDAAAGVLAQLSDHRADILVAFASPHHADGFDRVPELVREKLPEGLLIGCSTGGVIGGGREVEHRPGFSLTAANLPGVQLSALRTTTDELPDLDSSPRVWEKFAGCPADAEPHFLLLADPFTFDTEQCLRGLDFAYPNAKKIGGLASAARRPGGNALWLNGDTYRDGLVGAALSGDIEVDTIVAQGCRPIGSPMFITKCQKNILMEVDGKPPLTVLNELYRTLDPRDQELFRNSLFLGIVMDDFRQEYRQGDFLIRNIIGMDPDAGAVAIGAMLAERHVVQFHLRDAETSADDLEDLLLRYQCSTRAYRHRGALLFSCLGRGSYLYGRADHDTDLFRKHLGDLPLGGFFCNGEIGPVRGTTYVHGYTSSFGIFRSKGV